MIIDLLASRLIDCLNSNFQQLNRKFFERLPITSQQVTTQMSTRRSVSPIKVKDYFTNPLHKIKQPSFLQTGFNQSHLNTFVRTFANKTDPNLISISSIRKFIQSFTNGNPRLMQTYQDFFTKNFQILQSRGAGRSGDSNIQLQHFLQFFLRETQHDINKFSQSQWKKLFDKELFPLTASSLHEKALELEIAMSKQEARKIVKMINIDCGSESNEEVSYQNFLKVMSQ